MCWPKSLLNLKTLFLGAPDDLDEEECLSYGELGAEPARFADLTFPILHGRGGGKKKKKKKKKNNRS